MKRLMVVSPHADDAELGCGGYMSQIAQGGGVVHNVVVAVGDVFFQHLDRIVTADERVAELDASMEVLGATRGVIFFEHDRMLDTLPLSAVITRIEDWLDEFKPTEVLIPLPSSHQDHQVVYNACLAALRPSNLTESVQLIAAYEYPATSWGAGSSADAGKGGLYVDLKVQDVMTKLKALEQYKTQIREGGHCWSKDAAKAMAVMRGLESGLAHAELFHVLREVRGRSH